MKNKNNNKNFKLSEDYIIYKLLNDLHFNKTETFNFKNDAGFIKVSKTKKIIVTNDTINESVDFFKNDPPESIANKIITCNLSDISAMGAKPYCYTLSLSLPSNIKITWLKKFIKKLYSLQKKYNFFLLGGDLSKSNKIVISANFFGLINKKIINRIGAKINDDIWLTGKLGESSIGLLSRKKRIKLNKKNRDFFINKYLYPKPCMFGHMVSKIASSGIDISDGFYGDLNKLILHKNLGALIFSKLIPFSKYTTQLIKNHNITFHYLLTAGDDYELIFTSHPNKSNIINNLAKKNNIKISKVGKIIKEKGIFLDGKKLKYIKKSFQHFF